MRFLLLVILSISLHADYLVSTTKNNYCVSEYHHNINTNSLDIFDLSDNTWKALAFNSVVNTGYEYNTTSNYCDSLQVLTETGLTFEDYHYLLALIGLLTGFTFLFWSIFLVVEVSKRR